MKSFTIFSNHWNELKLGPSSAVSAPNDLKVSAHSDARVKSYVTAIESRGLTVFLKLYIWMKSSTIFSNHWNELKLGPSSAVSAPSHLKVLAHSDDRVKSYVAASESRGLTVFFETLNLNEELYH
jgi:hypothetical protein